MTKKRKLRAMAEAVATYEAEFGKISSAELRAQAQVDRRSRVMVTGLCSVRARRLRKHDA